MHNKDDFLKYLLSWENSYDRMLTEKIGHKTEYALRSQMWCYMCIYIYIHVYVLYMCI